MPELRPLRLIIAMFLPYYRRYTPNLIFVFRVRTGYGIISPFSVAQPRNYGFTIPVVTPYFSENTAENKFNN